MIDKDLVAAAKVDLARLKATGGAIELSVEDRMLLKKYPKHTLAAARLIDATPPPRGLTGCRCAFDLIQLQERSNFHLSGDHT